MHFLTSNYFFADEYTKSKNITNANITNIKRTLDERSFVDLGNYTFFRKDAELPPELRKYAIGKMGGTFDFTNHLPCPYVHNELELSEKELYNFNLVNSQETLFGKKFYKLSEFFDDKRDKVFYTLLKDDFVNTISEHPDLEYLKIHNNKLLTWY